MTNVHHKADRSMNRILVLVAVVLMSVRVAAAQTTDTSSATGRVVLAADPATETERRVQELLDADGLIVVHFWAPWCHNSRAELDNGWHEVIEKNGDVTFIFVTVYNDGKVAGEVLKHYSIPDRVYTFAQPDRGPSTLHANRRRTFLDLPLSWTPTTWVFHRRGQLAFAMNYGEVDMPLMQRLLDNARTNWSH